MTGHGLKTLAIAVLLAAGLIVAGALLPEWMLYTASITLAKGLVVLGLVLLLRMGLVSFGQGMYFCIGAYVCGLLSLWGLSDALLLVLLAGVGSGLVGLVLGLFLSAYRGVFFAMFNLALSMILYGVLLKSISIGGSDGIGVGAPSYFGFVPEAAQRPYVFYVFAVLVAVTAGWFARFYTRSETGLASSSARDCEIRLEYLGLSVRRLIVVNYVISAGLAGFGGGLVALVSGHIIPELAYWTTSGEFVFITVLSGPGGIVSAFAGTALFETIRLMAGQYLPNAWQLLLGSFLLLSIFFMPNGISALFERRRSLPGTGETGKGRDHG